MNRTRDLVLCVMFTALVAVGAFIKIPVPPVPVTLQDFFVMLAGLLLGAKYGSLSVIIYIVMGLIGFPIFTEGGGPTYLLKPSFGYIIGFAIGAFVIGCVSRPASNPGFRRMMAACFAGLGVVYLLGMVYYYLISDLYLGDPIGLWPLFLYCFLQTLPGDIVKAFLAAIVAGKVLPAVRASR